MLTHIKLYVLGMILNFLDVNNTLNPHNFPLREALL